MLIDSQAGRGTRIEIELPEMQQTAAQITKTAVS